MLKPTNKKVLSCLTFSTSCMAIEFVWYYSYSYRQVVTALKLVTGQVDTVTGQALPKNQPSSAICPLKKTQH